jgi:hypothetical protein
VPSSAPMPNNLEFIRRIHPPTGTPARGTRRHVIKTRAVHRSEFVGGQSELGHLHRMLGSVRRAYDSAGQPRTRPVACRAARPGCRGQRGWPAAGPARRVSPRPVARRRRRQPQTGTSDRGAKPKYCADDGHNRSPPIASGARRQAEATGQRAEETGGQPVTIGLTRAAELVRTLEASPPSTPTPLLALSRSCALRATRSRPRPRYTPRGLPPTSGLPPPRPGLLRTSTAAARSRPTGTRQTDREEADEATPRQSAAWTS